MTARRIVIAFVTVVAVVAGAVLLQQSRNATASDFDEARAKKEIESFGGLGSVVEIRKDTFQGKVEVFESRTDKGNIVWSDSDGRVIGIVGRFTQGSARSTLSTQTAMQLASEFIAGHHNEFEHMTLQENWTDPSGSYHFGWRKKAPSGAWLPQYATVVVNSETGALSSYHAGFEDTSVDTEPRLSAGKIEELWRTSGHKGDELQVVELKVARDATGQQRLVYQVGFIQQEPVGTMENGAQAVRVAGVSEYYDAVTGENLTPAFE